MKGLSLSSKLLLGRLLTRSGDQAWDFAVPLILLRIFPDQLRIAALYFLITKLIQVILLPKLTSYIDSVSRLKTAKLGIILQLVGVIVGAVAIFFLATLNSGDYAWGRGFPLFQYIVLIIGGVLSSLGSSFMDIAIANDLVPSSLMEEELGKFNSHLRQVDLFTEVASPVIAGALLLMDDPPLLGFMVIAIWNIVSFFPELTLLLSIFKERPDLKDKPVTTSTQGRQSLWQKLTVGWRAFFNEPVALVALAYAILWLSVLSPHGVLLAGFLKDQWHLPEWGIGLFRGAGAFFGLLATVLFPLALKRWNLNIASKNFICFQAGMLLFGLGFFFFADSLVAKIVFLGFVLLSRIGLYGFSLGEMQIRQLKISPEVRGKVNGFASALTGIATLGLYGAGALLPKTADFKYLIIASVMAVCFAAVVYWTWLKRQNPKEP